MPWRGKCFAAAGVGETVAEPTAADGGASPAPAALISRVVNRIGEMPAATATAAAAGLSNASSGATSFASASTWTSTDADKNASSSAAAASAERRLAPAVMYVGESAFDGAPALIVDYRGMKKFSTFRDEIRHVGCGVWLGKTYLTGPPSTLAQSLASVGGVRINPMMNSLIVNAMPPVTVVRFGDSSSTKEWS